MKRDEIVTLTIKDMSVEGQGIGRITAADDQHGSDPAAHVGESGPVVFVRGAVVGDKVKVRLTKVKKNFAFGRVDEILEASPFRSIDFDCPYHLQGCGGCPLGELGYEAQLKVKADQVRSRLERIAGIDEPEIRPIIGMDESDNDDRGSFRYRNKAVFSVSTGGIITKKGGVVEAVGEPSVGFYSAGTHRTIDCGDCYIQSLAAMAAADALRRFMTEDGITGFDPRWEKGLMRHMIVKTAFGTGEVMVVLVINGSGIPGVQKLIEMLDESIAEVGYSLESVVLNINKASGRHVEKNKGRRDHELLGDGKMLGDRYEVIAGKPVIKDRLGDLEMEISPASFYQVNPVQMKRLYDKVREYCEMDASAKPVILDLYCGIGSIGLYCADLAEKVIGIESVKEAVVDANRNSVINHIVNTRYIHGKAEEILAGGLKGNGSGASDASPIAEAARADIAILDPPRAGCRRELLEGIAGSDIRKIIYVSCDPATLARDIMILSDLGYTLREATPVDMFPHTGSVETVCLLGR